MRLQTTIADNVGLVERAWVDSINKRSKEKFLELHRESAVLYDPTLGSLKGRPALDKMWTGLFSMFPDYQIRKVRSFGQDDWVCLEVEETGTMKGAIHAGPREIQPTARASRSQARSFAESREVKSERCVSISMFLV